MLWLLQRAAGMSSITAANRIVSSTPTRTGIKVTPQQMVRTSFYFFMSLIIEIVSSFRVIDRFFFDILFSFNLLHFWMNAIADGLKTWKSRAKCTHRTNWKWFRITHKPLKIKYFEQFTCYQKRNVSSVQFLDVSDICDNRNNTSYF